MGRVVTSLRARGVAGTLAVGVLLSGVEACGRADDGQRELRAAGDVPWLGACADDADCGQGLCLCGLCSTPCVEGACGPEAPPGAACLEPEHWLSTALCAGRSDAPLCLTGCDSRWACEAGLECLDGFCVPSPAAAVAREAELVPFGPLCERDRVVWRSLQLERPEQVEALRGCERIEGNLYVDADAVRDLSALGSLRQVRGSIDIVARGTGQSADAPRLDLLGLERLESAGRLRLVSVALSSLAPLSALRALEGQDDSGLYLSEVYGLSSFDGLQALERLPRIELWEVADLRSLRGAPNLREVESLVVLATPLEELAEPGQLAVTGWLELEWTALASLQSLGASSRPSTVRIHHNPSLVNLEGLRLADVVDEISLDGNGALEDIGGLAGLRVVTGSLTLAGSPVQSLAPLEGLERAQTLSVISTTIRDLRGLERLTSADTIQLRGNAALATLAGLGPDIDVRQLAISESPALSQMNLANATLAGLEVSSCPVSDLSGLENVSVSIQLALDDMPNLTSLAGFRPSATGLSELRLRSCPLLTDLTALAGLAALEWLAVTECGISDLDALGSLQRLRGLELADNPSLSQIDALGSIAGLETLTVSRNPSLLTLPSFPAVGAELDPAVCGEGCGFSLALVENAGLQQGPSFPTLARAGQVRAVANPNLVSLGQYTALRSVYRLVVEGNPSLAVLGLDAVESASSIIVRGNALPESQLEALRAASAIESRIASNGAGPDRLDPCPWALDGVCDEVFESCAIGTDGGDCLGYDVPAWGAAESLAR